MDVDTARKSWELENNVKTLPSCDEIFRYDAEQQRQILDAKPWEKDPHYFKDIKISALSLLKMVMHARSGGTLEIMGGDVNEKRTEDKLTKATRDCSRASIELIHGLMAQIAKDKLFNKVGLEKK
ncbi:COP9 signalosome complex subunit 5 [Eumeta japonica]|uniref:COP9 signalosome complex subunit 5 n=1 Tax=Eumeta variegata TaxID=151549 RepID=A0A4C2A2B9_EUMVA|nr:COP9 signalosome complex subunit 5 [Eumeta japonica]